MSKPDPLFRAEVATADLVRAVNRISEVSDQNGCLPVLRTVKITAEADTLDLCCSDLDIEASTRIAGKGQGAACLPVHRLKRLLNALDFVERVSLAADAEGVVSLNAGTVVATMHGTAPGDFPEFGWPAPDLYPEGWTAPLAEGVLRFLVGGVAHAISQEETRYYLNGVALEVRGGALIAVATDGHRLAKREHTLTAEIPDARPVIVPRKAVALVLKLGGGGEARIAIRGLKAEITLGDVRLRVKLIDGTFPDWRRVIPDMGGWELEVQMLALRRALRLNKANLGKQRGRAVEINCAVEGLNFTSHDPESGRIQAPVSCDVPDGFSHVAVNMVYLDESALAMAQIGSKTLRLQTTGPGAPVRILPDAGITGALNILMPMRV